MRRAWSSSRWSSSGDTDRDSGARRREATSRRPRRRPGRRLPALRLPARHPARACGLRPQRRATGSWSRSRARHTRSTPSPTSWSARRPASRTSRRSVASPVAAVGESAFRIAPSAGDRPKRAASLRTSRPATTACGSSSTRRPPPPLPVHELHPVRSALHDRHRRPVRPRAARRWRRSRCAPECRRGVRGPRRPALPRRADRMPRVRPAPLDAARGRGRAPRLGRDRGGQGARRLPPRVRRGERGRRLPPARAEAPRGEALRGDGRRRPALLGTVRRARTRAPRGARPPDRPAPAATGRAARPVGRPGVARRRGDAPVHAAPPPPARRRRVARSS